MRTLKDCEKIWIRPEAMFFEEIERDGRRVQRFEEVGEEDLPCEIQILS